MSEPVQKITRAMTEWCRAIADPRDCRLVRHVSNADGSLHKYTTEGAIKKLKPSWAMAQRLEEAGLLVWQPRKTSRVTSSLQAELTAAGRAEAEREIPQRPPKFVGWPFPASTRYRPDGSPLNPTTKE